MQSRPKNQILWPYHTIMKIHILGAPGAGVTTLGKALATQLQIPCFDTDDYYWFTDDLLPYRRRRNPDHRRSLLTADLAKQEAWVLSGALCGWGDTLIPQFDAVIWLWLPVELRIKRIAAREQQRYGPERVAPGGDLHSVFEKFCTWAAAYDENAENIRSRPQELAWLTTLTCPVLKIENAMELAELTTYVKRWLSKT